MTDPNPMPAIYDALKWPNALRPKDDSTILPADIRKGDSIRVEYTDYKGRIIANEFWADGDWYDYSAGAEGNTYFLLDRPVPPVVLPTIPGVVISWQSPYVKRVATLEKVNQWLCGDQNSTSAELVRWIADTAISGSTFTVLRPEAKVAAEVLAEVRGLFGHGALMLNEVSAIAARWAAK